MPFKSISQANTCYATKKWDCDEWAKTTKWCQLPYKVGGKSHSSSSKCTGKRCDHFIHKGPRGGMYYECPVDGHKVYISKFRQKS